MYGRNFSGGGRNKRRRGWGDERYFDAGESQNNRDWQLPNQSNQYGESSQNNEDWRIPNHANRDGESSQNRKRSNQAYQHGEQHENRRDWKRPNQPKPNGKPIEKIKNARIRHWRRVEEKKKQGDAGRPKKKRPRRPSPPPHLEGKELGLWHIRERLPELSMNNSLAEHVKNVLCSLDSSAEVNFGGRVPASTSNRSTSYEDLAHGTSTPLQSTVCKMEDSSFKRSYVENIRLNEVTESGVIEATKESLELNEDKNEFLYEEFQAKKLDSTYQRMVNVRQKLPSYKMKDEIIQKVRENDVLVISGETGCGKTTQISQFILDDMICNRKGSECSIVCTQPRISAISVAQRVAEERGEQLGNSVGYQIKLEKVPPRKVGSILYCTTGIVLQWLQNNPTLAGVSHLVLDEIHERDVNSDFLICIVKDILLKRSDLKLILTSATLNAEKFSDYYNGCPMLNIPGFTYPVEEHYLEDVIEITGFQFGSSANFGPRSKKLKKDCAAGVGDGSSNVKTKVKPRGVKRERLLEKEEEEREYEQMILPHLRQMETTKAYSSTTLEQLYYSRCEELNIDLILELLVHISKKPPGAILVFLPSLTEISKLDSLIKENSFFASDRFSILPLHSLMLTTNQKEVSNPLVKGVRKIILATNIAETKITIEDVVYVIDAGRINIKTFDKMANLAILLPQWVTLNDAKQRRGRAGHVQKGECYHLFTKARKMLLDAYPTPEILRTPLDEILLHVKILKLGQVKTILSKFMEPPEEEVVDLSLQKLKYINALDTDENLTPLGYHLARLQMDPQIGKMMVMAAHFSCISPILTVASVLSFKDPFIIPMGKDCLVDQTRRRFVEDTRSDYLMYVNAYNGWMAACENNSDTQYNQQNFLLPAILNQLKEMRKHFMGLLYEQKLVKTENIEAKTMNLNSKNIPFVKAIITAGLYPNVARIIPNKRIRWKAPPKIFTEFNKKINFHSDCVNQKERIFPSPWLIFREKRVSSRRIYIYDSTCVSNYPLLFFGQKLKYNEEDKFIDVDGFVQMKCSKEIADIVQNLRIELDKLLEYKMSHSGTCCWDISSKEGKLLNTIVILINSEESANVQKKHFISDNHEDYYDD